MASTSKGLSTIADRYGTAIFELAERENSLDQVASDLRELGGLIAASDDLQRLLKSPVLAREDQEKALLVLMEKAGFSSLVCRFVTLVARKRRLFALEDMIAAYLDKLAKFRGEASAEVIAAHPLSEAQTSALEKTLAQIVGRSVSVNFRVEPRLLGGLIVKIGSRMVDSSLRTKLQRLQLAMKGIG